MGDWRGCAEREAVEALSINVVLAFEAATLRCVRWVELFEC